jgi:hypothetical protein
VERSLDSLCSWLETRALGPAQPLAAREHIFESLSDHPFGDAQIQGLVGVYCDVAKSTHSRQALGRRVVENADSREQAERVGTRVRHALTSIISR